MALTLTTHAIEKSTYVMTASFKDEDGNAVTPTSITWTLTDKNGVVINSKQDVAVITPAASINIVLSGDDLEVLPGETNNIIRVFAVKAIYDSATLGNDLPLRGAIQFFLDNLVAVT